jgi:hypothetical protein
MKNRKGKFRGQLSRKWRQHRPFRLAAGAVTLMLPIVVVASSSASAGVNLVVNPGAEQAGPANFPLCWGKYGSGENSYSIGTTSNAHSGSTAIQVTISKRSSGDRIVRMLENQSCAPRVAAGRQYNLGVWYMSSTPDAVISVYRHDVKQGWQFWMDLKALPATGTYRYASVLTPQIPPDTDQLSWGVTVYGKGTVITDDYSTADATVEASAIVCRAGAACNHGAWQVLPFLSPVRAIHAVLLRTGNVLLVAGSGNNPAYFAAGTFRSAVYNPAKGTFQVIPTPNDFFCSGHIQLPDGKVLVLGGNLAYPTANGSHGYEGLNTSYIFNTATNRYQRVNNLNGGHWYPSATELGNGDVISFGGLTAAGHGSTVTEYFKYNPGSPTDGQWLPRKAINQSYDYWGLYPAMILMQNGSLFYSGSHVFGNNIASKSDIYNIANILNPGAPDPVTAVPGLQDRVGVRGKDMTDQSMSVLLPPAQSQKVLLAGGGNINWAVPATRLTDLISLNSANPRYTPGPLLPRGKLSNGRLESASEGKMYVSMVLLPNGMVFETGGGLIDREAPVYEASMYNPATGRFISGMATDPVPRTYHSSAFLLPDGRVMAIGNNPGNGSFNMHISVYTPPYLFHGPRPRITSLGSTYWTYGSTQQITANQKIVRAELISPASVTHSSDPNQRFVALPLTVNGNHIGLNVTTNPNIAPPGWYMLFVTNANGVPSVARWVHVNNVAANR